MSRGYVFCTQCRSYRRWEDASNYVYPNGFLRCEHDLEHVCISDITPHIPNDDIWEETDADTIIDYEEAWEKNQSTPCRCGKVHILGFTFLI